MFTRILITLLLPAFLFCSFTVAHSKEYTQSQSLTGLPTVKIYFDVNMGIPEKLVLRLSLIDKTISQLKDDGVQPEVVIAFRGKASKFVTNGKGYVEKEDLAVKDQVHKWLESFTNQGIHMEQCLIAANLLGIAPEDVRSELTVTKNGFISMAAYQQRGFSMVPMD